MSDKKRAFILQFGLFFCWGFAVVQYFLVVGIMYLLSMVIPTEANIWLVGLIVLALLYINKVTEIVTKEVFKEMEEEEK